MQFHGGMSDEQREEVQRAFNSPPQSHPVRILIATDAAREGVNLQGHCADLFHFDIPWNPAKMEQRNGRIDRTLQPAPEVRCHYFVYPQRREDLVLRHLVRKVDTIRHELGSLSTVIMGRLADVMAGGIVTSTKDQLDTAATAGGRSDTARAELEAGRDDLKALRREIDEAGQILDRSRIAIDFDPSALKATVDVGLELTGATPLQPASDSGDGNPAVYTLPELPESWQETLDSLRPPRGRDEPFWEWRRQPPQPVVFEPPAAMNASLVHLHLQHPFVQRILWRFLAQGFSAHDLSRVTALRNPNSSSVRVIAFGRLSLFGPGAARLHDQLLPVVAPWYEAGGEDHLQPLDERASQASIDQLEALLTAAAGIEPVSQAVQERLCASAADDLASLWRHISDDADSLAHDAGRRLSERGEVEAEALRKILEAQRRAIGDALSWQLDLPFEETAADRVQKEQLEHDRRHMQARLDQLEQEMVSEPEQIRHLYQVVLRRLQPVGLVYLWPETRG
jgi:hypothetical protein